MIHAHFLARYYCDDGSLPLDLHLVSDERRGLRARVIRLLFLRCPTMIHRLRSPPAATRYELNSLLGMKLSLTWHEVTPPPTPTQIGHSKDTKKRSYCYLETGRFLELLLQVAPAVERGEPCCQPVSSRPVCQRGGPVPRAEGNMH